MSLFLWNCSVVSSTIFSSQTIDSFDSDSNPILSSSSLILSEFVSRLYAPRGEFNPYRTYSSVSSSIYYSRYSSLSSFIFYWKPGNTFAAKYKWRMNKEDITNHGMNKTVSDCITVDQVVKRMLTKMNKQIFVCLSTLIFHLLVLYAYKSKDCIWIIYYKN